MFVDPCVDRAVLLDYVIDYTNIANEVDREHGGDAKVVGGGADGVVEVLVGVELAVAIVAVLIFGVDAARAWGAFETGAAGVVEL